MGIPVDLMNWFEENERNFEYSPKDDETRVTMRDMQKYKEFA